MQIDGYGCQSQEGRNQRPGEVIDRVSLQTHETIPAGWPSKSLPREQGGAGGRAILLRWMQRRPLVELITGPMCERSNFVNELSQVRRSDINSPLRLTETGRHARMCCFKTALTRLFAVSCRLP